MPKSETAILTVLCMVYDGDQILLQDRTSKDWQGLTFPGGHVEPGESFVRAAIRETWEETGLTIQNPSLCGVKQFPTDDGERYIVLLFKASHFTGELRSSEEGEMRWVHRDELQSLTLVKDFFELLQVFDEDALNEFMWVQNPEDGRWVIELY